MKYNILPDLRLNNERLYIYKKGKRKRYILLDNEFNVIKIFKTYDTVLDYFIPF